MLLKEGIAQDLTMNMEQDPRKLFDSAVLSYKNLDTWSKACKVLKYFELAGKECRGLPFEDTFFRRHYPRRDEMCTIYVRNVPKTMKPSELDLMFSCDAKRPVKAARIAMNGNTSCGYGFVTYYTPDDATYAI